MDYRNLARERLQSAEGELSTNSDQRLKYAALELRMAMECLTYDRALAYKDEFPPDEYDTWQPRKVLAALLEIDPSADKDSSVSFGVEEVPGVPASTMQLLGSEKVLSMKVLREHYDALGSYLHMPTMRQAQSKVPLDFGKFRARCDDIAAFIDQVLSSRVFNITMGNFARMNCADCGKPMRKRIPVDQKQVEVECFECKATYTITDEGEGRLIGNRTSMRSSAQMPIAKRRLSCGSASWRLGGSGSAKRVMAKTSWLSA